MNNLESIPITKSYDNEIHFLGYGYFSWNRWSDNSPETPSWRVCYAVIEDKWDDEKEDYIKYVQCYTVTSNPYSDYADLICWIPLSELDKFTKEEI